MAVVVKGITEPICASQTLQLLPPQSTLVLERSHSELNPTEACFDWEKYSFIAQDRTGDLRISQVRSANRQS